MYPEFFGLKCSPFQLSPDPFFMFSSERSKEALASISDAIRQRKGFAVMTGEVGTGKTLVLRCLVESLEHEEIPFAYFIGPRLSTVDFLSYITFELGINVAEPSKGNLLRSLYGFLLAQFEKGLTTVLIIDEAHQMPRSVLEEIRLLTNFETAQQKLVQIVLVGQPELEKKLDSVELRSLKQRIAVRCRLEPLQGEEIRQYIERRLEIAGADSQAAEIFPPETIKAIHRYSLGIPRLINSICDQALIAAYARQMRVVPVEIIKEIAILFRLDPAPPLKQTEKPFSHASQVESSVADRAWQAEPASNVSSVKSPEPPAALNSPNLGNAAFAQTAPPPDKPEASQASSLRDDSIHKQNLERETIIAKETPLPVSTHDSVFAAESAPPVRTPAHSTPSRPPIGQPAAPFAGLRGVGQFDHILRNSKPIQKRRWLEPGLRLSLIVSLIAVVPVALATGVFMARRQKAVVTVPNEVVSPRETFPVTQTVASVQPAAATSSVPVNVGSVAPVVPHADTPTIKSAVEPEHTVTRAKIVMGALSKPVLKLPPSSVSTEPPLIAGIQTRGLELGNLNSAVAPPAEPNPLSGITSASNAVALPPAGFKSDAPVPVGGRIKAPQLLTHVLPQYPELARQSHAEGDVALEVVVDKSGSVSDAKIVSGPGVLRQAALDAVRRWKYAPSLLDGQPMSVQMLVTIRFRL
jgi:general secretion pathway protein A